MDAHIYQKGHREPLEVEDLNEIQYFSVEKDGQQTLSHNFSSFSLNAVVSEVKFIGNKEETVIVRAEDIESIKFDESF
ncbi:hypothetical protein FC35_GL001236 [Limosilactobacillus coleohominis DSM 14060]|nr:hypothetical protein FC35_GL001236 [Limosilactobacillus coleohominis DSM 14060]